MPRRLGGWRPERLPRIGPPGMTIEGPFRAVTVLDRVVAISAGPLGCTMRTLSFAVMLVPILSLADVLQCKIEAYN